MLKDQTVKFIEHGGIFRVVGDFRKNPIGEDVLDIFLQVHIFSNLEEYISCAL